MSPKNIAILVGVGLACGFVVTTQARAENAPATEQTCYNVGDATKGVEAAGGKLISLVDVPGDAADQLMVFELNGLIKIAPAYHGCMVAPPLALFDAKKPDRPV